MTVGSRKFADDTLRKFADDTKITAAVYIKKGKDAIQRDSIGLKSRPM